MHISSLDLEKDPRLLAVRVAGPAALLVAKAHKLGERADNDPGRLLSKDAHDAYRLLVAVETNELAVGLRRVLSHPLSKQVADAGITFLSNLFAEGADAPGSRMAGEAEAGVGEPEVVAASAAALAGDLIVAVGSEGRRQGE